MGYSIFIKAKDENSKNAMYDFLNKNMRSYNKEVLNIDSSYFAIRKDENLSYGGKLKGYLIGFDYNASGFERHYAFTLLKWMSETIAKEPRIYYYDGERSRFPKNEQRAIIKEAKMLMKANNNKEPLGRYIESVEFGYYGPLGFDKDMKAKSLNFINGEIERLDKLWTKKYGK